MVYVFLALSFVLSGLTGWLSGWFSSWNALWQLPLTFAGIFLGFVILFLLLLFVSTRFVDPKKLLEKPSRYFRFMLNQFCRLAFFLGGVHVHVTGLEKLPHDHRFLLVSNHLFAFDPLIYYYAIPHDELAFISKKENFSLFMVAEIMRELLCLPIDRENDRAALRTILKAIQFLKEDKTSIAVFPEGYEQDRRAEQLPQRRVQDRAEGGRSHRGLCPVQHPGHPEKYVPPPHGRVSRRAGHHSRRRAERRYDRTDRQPRPRCDDQGHLRPQKGAGLSRADTAKAWSRASLLHFALTTSANRAASRFQFRKKSARIKAAQRVRRICNTAGGIL